MPKIKMDNKLDKDLLLEIANRFPPTPGTYHVNHDDCPAGIDTRGRLYVTRKEDGVILGYCHHCGMSGYYHEKGSVRNIHIERAPFVPSSATTYPQLDAVVEEYHYLSTSQPLDVTLWLRRFGLDMALCHEDRWCWGKMRDRLMLVWPSFAADGNIRGFQTRSVDDTPPKCLTYGIIKPHIFNPHDSEILVIVEDRASGVKVAQAGFAACVMNGSSALRGPDAHSLFTMFDHFVVWYDMDNDPVRRNAGASTRALRMFTTAVSVVENVGSVCEDKIDPKRYTTDEIINTVTGCLRARHSPT